MKFIGEKLKKQRLSKKISLDQASNELKISKYILKKIENDEITDDLRTVFIIGHIRTYSNFLSLDSKAIIREFKNQNNLNITISNQIPKPHPNIFPSGIRKISPLFFILIIFSTFYFLFINNEDENRYYALTPELPEKFEPIIEKQEIELSKKFNQNKLEENDVMEIQRNVGASSVIASSNIINNTDGDKLITLKITNPTWIQLRDLKDKIIISKLMNKGEEYSYNLNLQYSITTGNAGNILVLIDNEVIGKIGKIGRVLDSFIIDNSFNK